MDDPGDALLGGDEKLEKKLRLDDFTLEDMRDQLRTESVITFDRKGMRL